MKRMLLFFATLWLGIMGASAQGYHYDVNNDGGVNVSDAVAVVNKILGKTNPGEVEGLEEVDLGLPSGTLWANINIGASSPEEYGNYYAWGETETKSKYSQDNYQYYQNGSYVNIGADISGTEYDVATVLWGDGWQMPTKDEFQELMDNCTSEWTTFNGVNGTKCTSKINGKSIFLPAAGYYWGGDLIRVGENGLYWPSSQDPDYSGNAYYLYFYSGYAIWGRLNGYYGLTVRPVRPGKNSAPAKAIDLGLPSGTLWASCNVGASKPEEAGDFYSWGENGAKLEYSLTTYLFWNNGDYISLGNDIGGTKYDVARMKWGENWRMPTYAECEELIEHCTLEYVTVNGIEGYKLISKINGNSIFLPATGFFDNNRIREVGDYVFCWSSTLAPDLDYEGNAYMLVLGDWGAYDYSRDCGLNIRPVRSPKPKDEDLYVDLGLPSGTKWASCNVGATKPEEYGEYFAWGELSEKKEYTEESYLFYLNDEYMDLGEDISGTGYDVAHQRWGGNWCMPTLNDIDELHNNCTSEWTTLNGVSGRKFTSKINGNSIFLPAAGYRWDGDIYNDGSDGYYWSSTQYPDGSNYAYYLRFRSGNADWGYGHSRYDGQSVRPVARN